MKGEISFASTRRKSDFGELLATFQMKNTDGEFWFDYFADMDDGAKTNKSDVSGLIGFRFFAQSADFLLFGFSVSKY
jgi:hypothetical protein